jgi:hypothetical protein
MYRVGKEDLSPACCPPGTKKTLVPSWLLLSTWNVFSEYQDVKMLEH